MPILRGMLLLAVAAAFAFALPAQTVSPRQLAERIAAREGIQTELPGADGDGGGGGGGGGAARRVPVSDQRDPPRNFGWQWDPIAFGVSFTQLLFWSLLAVATATLVALIVRGLRERRERRPPVAARRAGPAAPPTPAAAATAPEHTTLAADGHFGAAVHALLRQALGDLQQRLGGMGPSTTGREALRAAARVPSGIAGLRTLVDHAERWQFGGRVLCRADYETAVAAYAEWSTACSQPK